MSVTTLQLLIDAGLFMLIWIVQLVIYPGFVYSNEPDVKRWHAVYTKRITVIVLPLMLGQLVVYGYLAYVTPDCRALLRLALVLTTWLITFIRAVPLHHRIDTEADSAPVRARLVRVNWSRTLAWSVLFIISLIQYEC